MSAPKKPPHLLALTISTVAVFALAIFAVLNALGRWHEKDFSDIPASARNRYVNARLVAALKTFEGAIVPLAQAGRRAPPDASVLIAGLPECRKVLDDAPGLWTKRVAEFRQRKIDTTTTADRLAARLAALDIYLAQLTSGKNPRFQQALAFDASRWFVAVQAALQQPVPVSGPTGEMQLTLGCNDVVAALRMLVPEPCRQMLVSSPAAIVPARARQDCGVLENLDWREVSVPAVLRNFAPRQQIGVPERIVAQRNPWGAVPGCVYWQATAAQPGRVLYQSDRELGNRQVCESAEVSGRSAQKAQLTGVAGASVEAAEIEAMPLADARWSVPPSLPLILRPLDALRQPGSQLYQDYTDLDDGDTRGPGQRAWGRNTVRLGNAILDVGFSVDLTIDGATQAYAQQIASCYTGAQQVCRRLGVHRLEDEADPKGGAAQPIGHKLAENAMVRMAGIAVIDIATGRIEAIAGALSHCARQDNDGPGRGPECDGRLPWRPAFRRDLLENPALFQDSMPASTIKPIMAAAFLTDGDYGKHLLAQELAAERPDRPPVAGLRWELMRSDSARFLDRMFCREKGFGACERPWSVQRMAAAMGWDTACINRIDCGQRDVLFGRAPDRVAADLSLQPLATMAMFGRLLAAPIGKGRKLEDKRFELMQPRELDTARLRQCALGSDLRSATKDDWTDCRAGYTGQVVHEGWGQSDARASAVGVAGMMAMLGAAADGAQAMPAPHLVEGVRGVGDAAAGKSQLLTREQRADLAPALPVPIPAQAAEVILSGMNWSHRGGTASSACEQLWGRKACSDIDWIAGKTGTPSFHNDNKTLDTIAAECRAGECSSLRPFKWYAGVFRVGEGAGWNKAIAVLTERNWLKGNGPVHGAGDLGPNPAAEIGLLLAHCLRDNPTAKAHGACRQQEAVK